MPLLAEEDEDAVVACWEALGSVTASIPKELQPSYVRCLKVRTGPPAQPAARSGNAMGVVL